MSRAVLETSILIRHWRNRRAAQPLERIAETDVEGWANELIRIEDTSATLTPVVIEFLAGTRDSLELKLSRAYLGPFRAVDLGRILKVDWEEACRLAERVPASGRPRDLGDCLIRAVARRLNYEVHTFDTGMPR